VRFHADMDIRSDTLTPLLNMSPLIGVLCISKDQFFTVFSGSQFVVVRRTNRNAVTMSRRLTKIST
jgi:hypothetical protein